MSMTDTGLVIRSVRPVNVRTFAGGGFSFVMPGDAEVEARRAKALQLMESEAAGEFAVRQAALPHRCEQRPTRWDAQEREEQERSLGRPYGAGERRGEIGGRSEVGFLHPMRGDIYLRTLAGMIPELRGRLGRMRAEMEARPEEYGPSAADGGRVFDLRLWMECGEVWERADGAEGFARAAEATLAGFVVFVGCPRSEIWERAGAQVLAGVGMGMWSQQARWVVGTWLRSPHWPNLED